MSCLIYASNGRGQCIGKCDSNCYDAKHPECDCICGGRNHGVGQKKATENTIKYCDDWIDRYAKENKLKTGDIHVNPDIYQTKLF